MKKIRLDTLLVEQGYFADADAALRAVLAHEVKVGDVYATSAAVRVAPDAEVVVKNRKRFVSRGGHKLQGALDAFGQDVRGLRCLDIGSSTGGFSDCLLQAGAASVACVDVNYGQLAWKLRQDPRVSVFERVNIKLADPVELGAPFDVLVADLSFIGLAALAPVFARLSQPGTVFIGLVKPQFESRPDETERGVVRDEAVRRRTVNEVRAALADAGFDATGVVESPITGPEGNVEYLVRAVFEGSRDDGDRGEGGAFMSVIGNILWFIFAGFWQGVSWCLVGLVWCVTIVGIPVGTQCFKMAGLAFFPFGKEVEYGGGAGSAILNVLWFVFGGVFLALEALLNGVLLCITVIGIPFGLQCFKQAKLALLPFGAVVRGK